MNYFLSFPDFNIWSTPLLILVLQGLVLIGLLLFRYFRKRNVSDLFLALILVIVCYEQICYTVGFMGWYHAFPNTKINYWLIPMALALAPMIYFYVKTSTTSDFKFRKIYWLHFIPAMALVLYRLSIYTYDSLQPGFNDTQNGYLKIHLDEPIIQPILMFVEFAALLLYLAFTFQMFLNYRKKIKLFFSNTFKYELNWILTFLVIFSLLFIYEAVQDVIGTLITELHYTQRWWLNLLLAIATIYIGVKGYFTDTEKLKNLNFNVVAMPSQSTVAKDKPAVSNEELNKLKNFMETEKPYLDPELNLNDLATLINMNRAQLSQLINSGFQKNFNDFVNEYRIEAVKDLLSKGKQKKLSLLGIAYECGFNSKATFNRVFKKLTNTSPTDYLNSIS
ncbi:MAG: helix-turn-helix domain-containing protein [Bacteroidia bacterium]|nr:helix-turn-helix domain-containing protein [Bacteroidia bacterium]NNF32081.1 AraC family transcriptional regulator [Flavobacteriaceae bacterium]MBT8275120.1 helix-turn-helix domain-containing protein [Bacteroidia bacterium]NNJ82269.1 AraC family transcriptional regulator [Flavobacteriaceae bacterium]NNK54945.1 AraC family transcriptional regulator [Flavobacteriaceae bacterium]